MKGKRGRKKSEPSTVETRVPVLPIPKKGKKKKKKECAPSSTAPIVNECSELKEGRFLLQRKSLLACSGSENRGSSGTQKGIEREVLLWGSVGDAVELGRERTLEYRSEKLGTPLSPLPPASGGDKNATAKKGDHIAKGKRREESWWVK